MPRAVPSDTARRRRDRLSELIDALGHARGRKVTQREFAASIGREQGTIAAILGGHRALGGDVMMAVVQAYRLPSDYFDSPLRPDPRPYARAAGHDAQAMPTVAQAMPVSAPAIRTIAQENPPFDAPPRAPRAPLAGAAVDPSLGEVLAAFQPDRAVSMALEAIARKGVRLDADAWVRLVIGAQSAHEHGVLVDWFDRTLASLVAPEPEVMPPAEAAVVPMALVRESSRENPRAPRPGKR